MNPTFRALAAEAELAAEHLGIGATALSKANYAQQAYYDEAFFALSIGLERSAKLCILLDHCARSGGAFPDEETIRQHGHKLDQLLIAVDAIAIPIGAMRLPRSDIQDAIVEVLTLFAGNVTRYYNFQFLSGTPKAPKGATAMWFERVIHAVAEKHYTASRRKRAEKNAAEIEARAGGKIMVIQHDESGADVTSITQGSLATALNQATTPYVRMYVLQFARFLANVIDRLWPLAQKVRGEDIPDLGEIYALFRSDDAMFRTRKTWTTYE